MDDDLDSLGTQTIQEIKKSSKANSNQSSKQIMLMKLSSQGEYRQTSQEVELMRTRYTGND